MSPLSFYFDFLSPYSYLAFGRAVELSHRFGRPFEPVVVDLGALKLAAGNTGPSTRQMPLKSHYARVDMARWAARYGIPLTPPERNDSTRVNNGFYCADPARRAAYMAAVWKHSWGAGADVSREETLSTIAADMGWSPADFIAATLADGNARLCAEATRGAFERGVFGVPTIILDDQMWWGNDRLDFVEEYLSSGAARR